MKDNQKIKKRIINEYSLNIENLEFFPYVISWYYKSNYNYVEFIHFIEPNSIIGNIETVLYKIVIFLDNSECSIKLFLNKQNHDTLLIYKQTLIKTYQTFSFDDIEYSLNHYNKSGIIKNAFDIFYLMKTNRIDIKELDFD